MVRRLAASWRSGPTTPGVGRKAAGGITPGAYRFRPDGKRLGLRVVVGRLATLKVDQASIAEAQFSLAA